MWIEDAAGCWIWQGGQTGHGYGSTGQGPAHRHVWKLLVGPLDDGHELHHECGVRLCVRPLHLTSLPSLEHQRLHGTVKLTEAEVVEIRASRESAKALARQFGVSYRQIRYILTGARWAS